MPCGGVPQPLHATPNNPCVIQGRACSAPAVGTSIGRVDWTRYESCHLHAHLSELLDDNWPLTGWTNGGRTTSPGFVWEE
mmetsp:Transcript_18596/g.21399  ORF Transcript_18596/g.21399 Transcript_18596/m.21399 type:complete len:80 (+) Transcript_18596:753-992(+)